MNHRSNGEDEQEAKGRVRVRRSRAEREQLLSEYMASGETPSSFAARAGLKVGTLRLWLYKRRKAAGGAPARFAPVRIVGASPMAKSPGAITVRWPQGIEVEIPFAVDSAVAVKLVRELVAPCLR